MSLQKYAKELDVISAISLLMDAPPTEYEEFSAFWQQDKDNAYVEYNWDLNSMSFNLMKLNLTYLEFMALYGIAAINDCDIIELSELNSLTSNTEN
jgi:hypothetical protein